MERVENLVRLALAPGIGPVTVHRLLAHFGAADRILGAAESELRQVEGVRDGQVRAVREAAELDPRPELDLAAQRGVSLIGYDDSAYPAPLRSIYDPPFLLYIKGSLKPTDGMAMAIVGTRRVSHYGREQAERFGGLLARAGLAVVSGMARGVDSFAHRGALAAGGRTIAVVGSGLNHVYPAENRDLAAEIAESGCVLSEFTMDVGPARENFPRRNRLIAGLSLGVLVVEAPERSGALITARQAAEMNREIFAIPGRVDQRNAEGCHRLIRDGAVLVRNLEDILAELGPVADAIAVADAPDASSAREAPPDAGSASLPEPESRVLGVLSEEPLHIDRIAAASGLPVDKVSSALMILELKRAVAQKPGKFFVRLR